MICTRYWGSALFWGLAVTGACSSVTLPEHTPRRWFDACAANGDCGAGVCVCGFCTENCKQGGSCTQIAATAECTDVTSPSLSARCGAPVPSGAKNICVVPCAKDSDCATGLECMDGACARRGNPNPVEAGPAVYPTWTGSDGTWPTYPQNWDINPYPGFPYSLLSSELKANRLALTFAPREVWGTGEDQPTRRLDLLVTGDTMSGEFAAVGPGFPAVILLKRVR